MRRINSLRSRFGSSSMNMISLRRFANASLPPDPVVVNNGFLYGRMDYPRGWAFQQALLERRLKAQREKRANVEDDRDRILLFEHRHVYTLGRGADVENLTFLDEEADGGAESRRRLERTSRAIDSCRLSSERLLDWKKSNGSVQEFVDSMTPFNTVYAPNGTPIYRIERGGEVTYHGPGQLVVYPLLNLQQKQYKKDLHWYLRCIEEVIILTLKEYNIRGERDEINTGVWVNKKKIAAIGLSSSRWITTHGFALNINPDLEMFDTSIIIPCGIAGRGVTSIANELRETPCISDVSTTVLGKISEVFDVPLEIGDDLK